MELLVRRARAGDGAAVAAVAARGGAPGFPEDAAAAGGDAALLGRLIAARVEGEVLMQSLLCMVVADASGELVAFAAFDDVPPPGIGAPDTERALAALDARVLAGAGAANTLFMTRWAAGDAAQAEALEFVMRTLLATLPATDYIVTCCEAGGAFQGVLEMQGFVEAGSARGGSDDGEGKTSEAWAVLAAPRVAFAPALEARTAQVEDYDDLVKIFDAQSQVLSQLYGEYFLAELIECQDSENKAIVPDLGGEAKGLMCLSTEIDTALLRDSFFLEPFDGLAKAVDDGEGKSGDEFDNDDGSNVFAVTLFCIDQEHRSRVRDVLAAAFECFPDRDYCALTLPNDVYESALLPYFFQVPVRDGASISHSLYLLHRDSLRALHHDYLLPLPEMNVAALSGEGKASEVPVQAPRWVGGSQLQVRAINRDDEAGLLDLLAGIETQEDVMADVRDGICDKASARKPLAIEVLGQVVGVAVVEIEDDADAHERVVSRLDQLFAVRGLAGVPSEAPTRHGLRHGILLHFVLVPIFKQFSRALLQDVMRRLGLHALHYKLFPGSLPPAAVVEEMVQVRPRRLDHLHRLHRRRHLDEPRDKRSRYALFSLTKSTLSEPRLKLSTRIVVVGASETGLAALEELLLVPHAYLPKITLVTPGGIPDERFEGVRELCTEGSASPGAYCAQLLDRLGMRDRITVIEDRMVYLEREACAVVLADGSLLEYDYLVLATGLQDTTLRTACDITLEEMENSKPLSESVFSVSGDPMAATTLRRAVQHKHRLSKEQCVVYGATLEALAAVQALLVWGKPGKYITWAHSGPADSWEALFKGDVWAVKKIRDCLEQSQVTVLPGLSLSSIERVEESGRISKAIFEKDEARKAREACFAAKVNGGVVTSTGKAREVHEALRASGATSLTDHVQTSLAKSERASGKAGAEEKGEEGAAGETADAYTEIPCSLLVSAGNKNIDPDIFASINDTGLVYDGRMVVDAAFRTVDPNVFGAGTNTKFSRRYRVKHSLEHFNSREVGAALAASLLGTVDPLLHEDEGEQPQSAAAVAKTPPRFALPKVQASSVELPGAVRYHRACRPGWSETAKTSVLETMSADSFCRLQLDKYGYVAAVSYGVTDQYFSTPASLDGESKESETASSPEAERRLAQQGKNRLIPLAQLVGIHISYLNDIERQLEIGEIVDLIEFFSRDWAAALFHDRFGDFYRSLLAVLGGKVQAGEAEGLRETLAQLSEAYRSGKDDLEIAMKRNELVGPGGSNLRGQTKGAVQSALVAFLRENVNVLEMYHLGSSQRS